MSSATTSITSDFQPELSGVSTAPRSFRMSSPFCILENLSPAKNEEICVMNGFPGLEDIIELPAAKPKTSESKIDKDVSENSKMKELTAQEAFKDFVNNVVLNFDERNVLSRLNDIVRQIADYSLNPQQISSSIERMIKLAKDPIDFSKIAAVLNYRLQNSELKYASVALQVTNKQKFFVVIYRGETVLRAKV